MPSARATHEPSLATRLGLAVGIAIALTGCGEPEVYSTAPKVEPDVERTPAPQPEPVITYSDTPAAGDLSVIVDRETGCEYIQYNDYNYRASAVVIVPRMATSGKQVCRKAERTGA